MSCARMSNEKWNGAVVAYKKRDSGKTTHLVRGIYELILYT